ncbi:Os04g0477025 [Oryza sativa Japonica Group]|uniref:Os04g0477025 protein n=1 Tax=Oryza sativa subsp. japonica TaxID=39947 RepID=A0A0P0WBR8_ORYSJ|nr:hypothetical protein EE612_023961 [Oryza sativa]BAS89701.1 Os04g0477025 [Oryza sativa Japonica Group]
MHTLRYVSMARYRSSCSGRAKSGTASATAIILSSGVRASFVATIAKNPSTSLPTRTIAPCDTAAMDVERRAPSSSPLSADIDRRCLPARAGLPFGLPDAAACRSANSSSMVTTASTSYSTPPAHGGGAGIRRSLTLASSSCDATLLVSSAFDAGEAPRMFAALRSFSKKPQETAFLSAGSKLTIFSTRRRWFLVARSALAAPPPPPPAVRSAAWWFLAAIGSHRRA